MTEENSGNQNDTTTFFKTNTIFNLTPKTNSIKQ